MVNRDLAEAARRGRGEVLGGRLAPASRPTIKGTTGVDASIFFVLQDGKTREIPLKPHTYTVGRHTDCQFRLPEGAVSRHHAEISFDGDRVSIRDLESSNGTYLNKERIESERDVDAGDIVSIGTTLMVFKLDGIPAEIDAAQTRSDGEPEVEPASNGVATGPKTAIVGGDEPASNAPTAPVAVASDASGSGLMDDLDLGDSEGSSFGDFEFDFSEDDDEDDQPAL